MTEPAARHLFEAYLRQQEELGMPGWVLSGPRAEQGSTPPGPTRQVRTPRLSADAAGTPPPADDKRAALREYYFSVNNCQECSLGATRKTFVFGAGSASAPVMVIGEAPGETEDIQGMPFVGAAGGLLTRMLEAIGLDRKEHVFITNILKCRPPMNRDPSETEIAQCSGILSRQVDIIAPRAILLLGRVACHALLSTTKGIGELRGTMHTYKGIPVVVTYHPAALLRNAGYKRPAWEDLQRLQKLLQDLSAHGRTD